MGSRTDPWLPAGAAVRHEIQRRDGLGDVERLGMGHGGHRNEPDVVSKRCDPGRDQDGVCPTGQSARVDFLPPPRLGAKTVIDGEKVQQAAFGGGGKPCPVPARGHRRSARFGGQGAPPGLRMPPVTVERDAEMQRVLRHHTTV